MAKQIELGWWVEYINEEDGEPALGVTHPIVIRDAERAKKKNVAPPRRGEIAWRTCDEVEYKNLGLIGVDARSATYLVLDRDSVGETGAQLRQKMPDVPKQIRVAIEHGTPNVISIQPGSRCGSCGSGQPSEADGCSMLKLRKFLTDEWPGRADELPIKLRRMREQIFRKNLPPETKISVLTQEPTRIWAGYYYSQLVSGFLPTSSSLRSGRV